MALQMKMFANNEHIVPYYSNNAINIKEFRNEIAGQKKKRVRPIKVARLLS
jgi:hypothetical protein